MTKPRLKFVPFSETPDSGSLEDRTLAINRSAAVVKGGRRFSFSALTVVGNRDGYVGLGYAKAREVPSAVEKSIKDGRKHMLRVPRAGSTIPHPVEGRYGKSLVRMIPASPGTGIIAGGVVRQVAELAGVADILTKSYGSTNPINLAKAAMVAMALLRDPAQVGELRGVAVRAVGQAFKAAQRRPDTTPDQATAGRAVGERA